MNYGKWGSPGRAPLFRLWGCVMDNGQEGFTLSVTIPAAELAQLRRRVSYLEAVLIQVMREGHRIKEWFSAADLVGLRLPGLPASKAALTRLARTECWLVRAVPCQGGNRHEYHFSSLPRRAFEGLIDLVLLPPATGVPPIDAAPVLPDPIPVPAKPENTAPFWLLPLMRIIKRKGHMTVDQAVADLSASLPAGVVCPTVEEALNTLRELGMVG